MSDKWLFGIGYAMIVLGIVFAFVSWFWGRNFALLGVGYVLLWSGMFMELWVARRVARMRGTRE